MLAFQQVFHCQVYVPHPDYTRSSKIEKDVVIGLEGSPVIKVAAGSNSVSAKPKTK